VTQTDRLYKLERWFKTGRCVTRDFLLRELEVSPATLKRDIAMLRDRLAMPLEWEPDRAGWRLDLQGGPEGRGELPGLWFSPEEAHALLTMQQLLSGLDAGGLLGPHIEPLRKRLNQLLGKGAPPKADVARRVRVLAMGARKVHLRHFEAVGAALLRRQRLLIRYRGRSRGDVTEREVSPQRLVHYRDNWYLDAWCHWRDALRSFGVDAIERVQVLAAAADEVPDAKLDAALGVGYGIFAGRHVQWAMLRFSTERARWVAAEVWHPLQRGRHDARGRWLLDVPYTDPRELVMDILRHVPEVEVIAPDELRVSKGEVDE
jgi:predicted DNA-binding transcriptional regulator YafY